MPHPKIRISLHSALLLWPLTLFSNNQNWSTYLGDAHSSQYSTLDQITTENVDQLEVAWRWDGGMASPENRSQIQCNPIVIDGVLYGSTAMLHLVALDAATGEQLWSFNPFSMEASRSGLGVNRGLTYWESTDRSDRRILYATSHFLWAIDAWTGKPIPTFGKGGRVDLRENMGRDSEGLFVISNSPGAIFENTIAMPVRVNEGPGGNLAPGHIRAYDVITGEMQWIFHTIPQPGQEGFETWSENAHNEVGGANVWSGISVDPERGIFFCPTGSASFDFWGGNRLGDNLYANSLIALDARTGERIWHYQIVRHDLWDRDLPASPNLLTIERDGKPIPAVAQITKSGHVFVFHRETGEPLFPIEDIMVPSSDLIGEVASPTQPLPTIPKPFARQIFSADLITDISAESRRAVLERFHTLRPHMPFTPPSTQGTIIFPGFDGGGEWGGAAHNPDGILYVNGNEMPWVLTMVDAQIGGHPGRQMYLQNCAGCHGADLKGSPAQNIPTLEGLRNRLTPGQVADIVMNGKGVMPNFKYLPENYHKQIVDFILDPEKASTSSPVRSINPGIPYTHTGYRRWTDPDGYPAVKPPWGTLNAIDLNTGEYLWAVPLGEVEALTQRGVPPTGIENYGGPVVTAGGLLFIAATKDEFMRAFDTATGEELWKFKLPAGGYATPATYSIDGKQYVVIACGGGKMGTPSGDTYLAFSLPQ